MDLHLIDALPTAEERVAVDEVLGPPRTGWEGGPRSALDGHVSAFLWTEPVWMSLLLVVLIWIHESNATVLGDLFDSERHAYARVT